MADIERFKRYLATITGYRDDYKIELAELSSRQLNGEDKVRLIYVIDRIRYANNTISMIEQTIAKLQIKAYA